MIILKFNQQLLRNFQFHSDAYMSSITHLDKPLKYPEIVFIVYLSYIKVMFLFNVWRAVLFFSLK